MKRATAERNIAEIARRLRAVNGLLATPNCSRPAYRFRRVWVFGSTVKGSMEPGDLDILIDGETVGRRQQWTRGRTYDHSFYRSAGIRAMPDTDREALKWLTRNLKLISRHDFKYDGEIAHPRILIYPRNDFQSLLPPTKQARITKRRK